METELSRVPFSKRLRSTNYYSIKLRIYDAVLDQLIILEMVTAASVNKLNEEDLRKFIENELLYIQTNKKWQGITDRIARRCACFPFATETGSRISDIQISYLPVEEFQ